MRAIVRQILAGACLVVSSAAMPVASNAQMNVEAPRPLTSDEEAEDRAVEFLARDFFSNVKLSNQEWLLKQSPYIVLSSYDAPSNEIVYKAINVSDVAQLIKDCCPSRFGRTGSSEFVDEKHDNQAGFLKVRSQPWRGVTSVSDDGQYREVQWQGWSVNWVCSKNSPYDEFDIQFQRDGDHLNYFRVVTQFSNRGR